MSGQIHPYNMNGWPSPNQTFERDDYYVSITNLLLGQLFIFLTFFASQLQATSETVAETDSTRVDFLEALRADFQRRGCDSEINTDDDILHLSAVEMPEPGADEATPEGMHR